MAKEETEVVRGTKRQCPETGKKFYDLEKDPIISPYTGKEYPLSFFEEVPAAAIVKDTSADANDKVDDEEIELETGSSADDGPEFVSLEDADADDDETSVVEDIPDIDGDDNDEITVDNDDNTFLETDDDDDSDVSDLIVATDDDEN